MAENVDDLAEALAGLAATLAGMLAVVIGLLALLIWWLTGRTLAPVETIRSEVDSIGPTNADHRVHVPAGDDEISRLALTMNRMIDRLDNAADHQRRFVADAAHELRTPLTRIRTNVEVDIAQPGNADWPATNHAVRQEVVAPLPGPLDDVGGKPV